MNNDISNQKLKIQDIMTEINNLKKYNNDLMNNVQGEKLEDYLNKLHNSIIQTQNKVEELYTNISK